MSKRLYEIARELKVSSAELTQEITDMDPSIDAKDTTIELTDEQIAELQKRFTKPDRKNTETRVVKRGVVRRRVRRKVDSSSASEAPAEAAEAAPEATPETAPEPAAEAAEKPVRRRRMATVVTREPAAAAEDAAAPEVAEAATASAEAGGESGAAAAAEESSEAPRSRFATVHTRPAESEEAASEEPAAEPAAPRSRFATLVTNPAGEAVVPNRPTMRDLAASQATEAPATDKKAARVVGTMNPELLGARLQADRKDFGPRRATGEGPDDRRRGKKGKGKRVVQSRDLYDKFNRRSRGKKGRNTGPVQQTQITQAAEHKRVVKMEETIIISDLAHQMGVKAGAVAMKLMFDLGIKGANINTAIDFETATLVAEMYEYRVEQVGFDIANYLPKLELKDEDKVGRPPVVTVMGHVDHGKTSLLDAIRSASVATGEAGGITQHIGAYQVELDAGMLTFLDTPGHEAFTALRARGAVATDITVLVVAADDGVMPQTVEAINHSKDANVPIIVAVNKCDKPGANPERVKQALSQYELIPEDWGGTTLFAEVSALTQEGIPGLLEQIYLQSELMELKAHFDRPAEGIVIESRLDIGRGPVATMLVQEGTLTAGQTVVVGEHYGRVRTMSDERGDTIDSATPAVPVEITGLNGVPASGERFYVVDAEKNAKEIANHVGQQNRQAEMALRAGSGGGDIFATSDIKTLKVIVKADVQGSVEAVIGSLTKLSTEDVEVRVIHSGVGTITESDVNLAASSEEGVGVVIVGFNTKPDNRAQQLAEQQNALILTESIIYDIIDKVTALMTGMLEPVYVEEEVGQAEVRAIFFGKIAGCMVLEGKMLRGEFARVMRKGEVVHESKVASLRRVKENVAEVRAGLECGLTIEGFVDFEEGDTIVCHVLREEKATL